MAFSKPKAKTSLGEVDMLSNLTEEVRVKILTHLKLDEAGRTSVLSSKWRYTWTFIPELAISDDYIWGYGIYADSSSYAEEIRCRRFEKFVDIIFVLHTSPIRKCKLSTMLPCCDGFDRWILNLSRNGIEELTLDIGYNGWTDYILNSSFFNCEKLSCVNLTQLAIIIPSWFKGFNHVHTIALQFVLISTEDIGKLTSSCPQLKILKLRELRVDPFSLSIDAPNLESLELGGSFENILICGPKLESFELSASYSDLQIRAPNLISLFIEMIGPLGDNHGKKNFLQFLGEAPELQKFQTKGFMYLSFEPWLVQFLSILNHLKNAGFVLDICEEKEPPIVLTSFQRAPHLQSFDIHVDRTSCDGSPSATGSFWEAVKAKKDLFKCLEMVKITLYFGYGELLVLPLVKFILGSAPRLSSVTITREFFVQNKDHEIMLRQLMSLPRASPRAKIMLE